MVDLIENELMISLLFIPLKKSFVFFSNKNQFVTEIYKIRRI